MKNYLILTILLISSLGVYSQNDARAKKLLDDVSETMSAYNNVSIQFDYVLFNKSEDVKQELSGDVTLQDEKYLVHLFGTTQMFDGTNVYTIIPENEEVNISKVDTDDNNSLTPSKFYSFYKTGYTYQLGEKEEINGKQVQFVKLTPIDSNAEINNVLVGITTHNNHIYKIIEVGKNGTDTILTVNQLKTNQTIDSTLFIFDTNKYEKLDYIINN